MRSVDLAPVMADGGGGREIEMLTLLDAWAHHVVRLFREATSPTRPTIAWGVHDYIGALYIRDRVERGLLAIHGDPPPTLDASDELFRVFTESDDRRSLRAAQPDIPEDPWWWQRIPKAGQVSEDLADIVD